MNAGTLALARRIATSSSVLVGIFGALVLTMGGPTALFGPSAACAQNVGLPVARLTSIFPPGGKLGTTFEVTIDGTNLDGPTPEAPAELRFSDPGVTATPKMAEPGLGQTAPQPAPGVFEVTIKPDAKLGLCDVRLLGKYGLSNPRVFAIGSLPEMLEQEPNDRRDKAMPLTIGSTVNGRSNQAGDVDYYKFSAHRGEQVILDVWAYRIDSRMDATLTIYNAAGDELAHDRDTNRLDPLVAFKAPEDGEYYVTVYDFLYGGGRDYPYRLNFSAAPYIDFIFPPAGQAGTRAKFTVYGRNLPGGQPAKDKDKDVVIGNQKLEMLSVEIPLPAENDSRELRWGAPVEPSEAGMDAVEWRLDSPAGQSNSVLVGVVNMPVVVETEPNDTLDKTQPITLPCEICGQFNPRRDQDRFSFEVKKGDVFWIDVVSERMGEPTDPCLLVDEVCASDPKNPKVLQDADDTTNRQRNTPFDISTEDPFSSFTAPEDGLVRVTVRDLYYTSTGDPRHIYRLAIHRPQPDFRLAAIPRMTPTGTDLNQIQPAVWSTVLRRGGGDMIDVYAYRRDGFDGAIEVRATGLPPGVTSEPITIAPGQTEGYLVLAAAADAAPWSGEIGVAGFATIDSSAITRAARPATFVWAGKRDAGPTRSRLARGLTLAVAVEQAPYAVQLEASAATETCRGNSLNIPVRLVRNGDFKEKVSLMAFGLPKEFQPKQLTIEKDKSEGSLEIVATPATKPGAYSFTVLGLADVNYAHNPEATVVAQTRKAAIDKLVAERTAAATAALDASKLAEQAMNKANESAEQAKQAQAAAEQKANEESAAAVAAAEQSKTALAAASKQTNDDALARAAEAAEKTSVEVAARAKVAAEAKAAAEKNALAQADAAKTAATARAVATTASDAAAALVKETVAFQQTFDKTVTDLVARSKPQNVKVGDPSRSLTLKITPAPITFKLGSSEATAHAGDHPMIPVTIARLYGYEDAVQIRLKPNTNIQGVKASPIDIARDATTANFAIEIGPDAKPGKQPITIEALSRLKGQELVVGEEFQLTVEPPPSK